MALSTFSYTQNHRNRGDTSHSGLGPLTLTITQNIPTGQSDRGIFQGEGPSSKMALVCVKLTRNKPTQHGIPVPAPPEREQ